MLNRTAGEVCDDGANNGSPLRCDASCEGITPSVCGNSVMEVGESCDTGGASTACDSDCSMAACGDETTNTAAGEVCDEGRDNGSAGSACSSACEPVEPLRLDGVACTATRGPSTPSGLLLVAAAALLGGARRRRPRGSAGRRRP